MGMYSEFAQGEMNGIESALLSDQDLWQHAQSLGKNKYNNEYLIGYGAGLVNGQATRKHIRDVSTVMPFDEKISLYLYILKLSWQIGTPNRLDAQAILRQQGHWHHYKISQDICAQSLCLLQSQQLQRAITLIHKYYLDNFYMAAWRSFEQIAQLLVQIRADKKTGTLTPEARAQQRRALEQQLRTWIAKHGI